MHGAARTAAGFRNRCVVAQIPAKHGQPRRDSYNDLRLNNSITCARAEMMAALTASPTIQRHADAKYRRRHWLAQYHLPDAHPVMQKIGADREHPQRNVVLSMPHRRFSVEFGALVLETFRVRRNRQAIHAKLPGGRQCSRLRQGSWSSTVPNALVCTLYEDAALAQSTG